MPADRLVMVIDRDFGSGPDEQNPDDTWDVNPE
jgi:hypothetical protein